MVEKVTNGDKEKSKIDATALGPVIKDILSVVKELPDKFQEKCFEILLTTYLQGSLPQAGPVGKAEIAKIEAVTKFVVPIDVRALFSQYGMPEESIQKLFLVHGGDIRPIFTIKTTKKSKAQIQVSLMTALENALRGGKFEFDMEEVRKRCDEYKSYDSANYKSNFKNNSKLFKSLSDEEHVELSPDGKALLAETIAEIAK